VNLGTDLGMAAIHGSYKLDAELQAAIIGWEPEDLPPSLALYN
jgi:hypothetical protein